MKKKLYFFIDDSNDCISIKIRTILNNYYIKTSNKKAQKPNIFTISKSIKFNTTVNDIYIKLKEIIMDKTIYNNLISL